MKGVIPVRPNPDQISGVGEPSHLCGRCEEGEIVVLSPPVGAIHRGLGATKALALSLTHAE